MSQSARRCFQPHLLVVIALLSAIAVNTAGTVVGADRDQVRQAVTRGVEYLRSRQTEEGRWNEHEPLGCTALCTLALIESGVPLNDPAVRKGVQFVRTSAAASTHTYSISLAIMLLDRVGDRDDTALIRRLGERLRDGQNQNGSWTYFVPQSGSGQMSEFEPLRRIANMGGLGVGCRKQTIC